MDAVDLTNLALDAARDRRAWKTADAALKKASQFEYQGVVVRFSGNNVVV